MRPFYVIVYGESMKDLNRVLRPHCWNDIVGQQDIAEICQKSLAEDKFPKFSIFYGPTGVGKSCMAELVASELVGYSGDIEACPSIKKLNMAALLGKKDIVAVIDSIFKYMSTASGKFVYILEEVQVLRQKEEQTPFLEELTRIPEGVYIMMCTTKLSALSIEMRNRAVAFQLTLPTYDECLGLVTRVTDKLGLAPLTPRTAEVLIRSSNYTPRSIIKHIELLCSFNTVQEDDVNKFFKIVSNETYIRALNALIRTSVSLYEAVKQLNALLSQQHTQNFMYGLRDFAMQYLIERASGEKQLLLTKTDRALITELLAPLAEAEIAIFFEHFLKVDIHSLESTSDTLAELVRIKLMTLGKTPTSILKNNNAVASETLIQNKKLARQQAAVSVPTQELVSVASDTDLAAFGLEDNTVYEE